MGLPALRSRLAQRRDFGRADDGAGAPRANQRRRRAAAHSGRCGQCADPARAAARVHRLGRIFRRARQQRADGGSRALARGERLRAGEHGARRRRLRHARRHSRPLSARRRGADPARLLRRHARIDPRLRSGDPALDRAIALARSRADERSATDDGIDPPLPPGLCAGIRRADPRRRPLRRGQRGPPSDRPRALATASLRTPRHALRLCRKCAVRARRAR